MHLATLHFCARDPQMNFRKNPQRSAKKFLLPYSALINMIRSKGSRLDKIRDTVAQYQMIERLDQTISKELEQTPIIQQEIQILN